MLTLHTETVIDCAHYLKGYDGACANQHGHSVFLEIWIRGTIDQCDDVGILFDFGNVKKIKDEFDHKLINEHPYFKETGLNPTAENISHYIYCKLSKENPGLQFKVRFYETKVGKETWCEEGDWS